MAESAKNTKVRAFLGISAPVWSDTHNIEGANNASVSFSNNLLDVTNFDSVGWVEKIKGLKQLTGSFDNFIPNSSYNGVKTGYGAIVNYYFNQLVGEKLFIQVVLNDYLTIEFEAVSDGLSLSANVSGTKDSSVPFESTGAITVTTA